MVWLEQPEREDFSGSCWAQSQAFGVLVGKSHRSSHITQVTGTLIVDSELNGVPHSIAEVKSSVSVGFSDIKHRNEHSLYLCADLKALPIFKNIYMVKSFTLHR